MGRRSARPLPGCSTVFPERAVLDLSRLGFSDSSGLHATIEPSERSAAQNTRLVIIPRLVQRMFEITGLLEMLPFVEEPPRTGDDRPPAAPTAAPASSASLPKA